MFFCNHSGAHPNCHQVHERSQIMLKGFVALSVFLELFLFDERVFLCLLLHLKGIQTLF